MNDTIGHGCTPPCLVCRANAVSLPRDWPKGVGQAAHPLDEVHSSDEAHNAIDRMRAEVKDSRRALQAMAEELDRTRMELHQARMDARTAENFAIQLGRRVGTP